MIVCLFVILNIWKIMSKWNQTDIFQMINELKDYQHPCFSALPAHRNWFIFWFGDIRSGTKNFQKLQKIEVKLLPQMHTTFHFMFIPSFIQNKSWFCFMALNSLLFNLSSAWQLFIIEAIKDSTQEQLKKWKMAFQSDYFVLQCYLLFI